MVKPINKPQVIQLLNPFIDFGRCCGIIPLRKCSSEPYFEFCPGSFCCNIASFVIYLITLIISLLLLVESFFISSGNIVNFVCTSSQYVTYYIHCEVTLIVFMLRYDHLIVLLQKWIDLEGLLLKRCNIQLSISVKRQCWLIYFSTATLFTIESVLFVLRKVIQV